MELAHAVLCSRVSRLVSSCEFLVKFEKYMYFSTNVYSIYLYLGMYLRKTSWLEEKTYYYYITFSLTCSIHISNR